MTDNVSDNVSPLARRLAATPDVDLSALARGPEAKITARSVLEHLSATEPARRRAEPSRASETEPSTDVPDAVAAHAQPESPKNVAEVPAAPREPATDPALERTRAHLQAPAQVHQHAGMQVGSLRERNSALEQEAERLRAAEAQAELQRLAEQKAQLERDLERSRSGAFSWLKKLIS